MFCATGYTHNPYNGVIYNDTILATGVFSSKELWRLSKSKLILLNFFFTICCDDVLKKDKALLPPPPPGGGRRGGVEDNVVHSKVKCSGGGGGDDCGFKLLAQGCHIIPVGRLERPRGCVGNDCVSRPFHLFFAKEKEKVSQGLIE